jgi:dihydrofolate reductase
MSKLRVNCFSISLDGFGAGPEQALENPMGLGGMDLHQWVFGTRFFNTMIGQPGGREDVDNRFAEAGAEGLGAWILGRNMFGPVRGPWPDGEWKGWWGPNPPYHVPVFVLTHHAREPLEMEGGTTFHFVTGGAEEALERARAAAGDKDIRVGGGASTVRQYLAAGQIDEMHIVQSPVVLGRGEPLFAGLDLKALGYACTGVTPTDKAVHYAYARTV